MKFLIFNIVVAAALVFLFAGDKGDLTAIAGETERLVADIKSKAVEAIDAKSPEPPPVKQPAVSPPKPAVEPAATEAPVPTSPAPAAKSAPVKPAGHPLPAVDVADRSPTPPLPPDVAKRRAEVLNAGDAVVSEGTVEKFMPADIRKRELMLLSEEMELFSARAISR